MMLFAALLALPLQAPQEDPAELKARILRKVAEKMAAERAALLKRIDKIIDEELAKEAPAPQAGGKTQELERRMRALEEEKERLAEDLAKAKRDAADDPVRAEAKKSGPHDLPEAKEMFDQALELHDKDKNFKESIRLFKRIYFQFPKHQLGVTSAYNVACGYALANQKEEALDWLELSVKSGFAKIDHLRNDPDLDNLRAEKRYKRLLTDR
ncbi:MAG TPA: hypothetical protein VF950_08320 [Planctomycetota bacterium]